MWAWPRKVNVEAHESQHEAFKILPSAEPLLRVHEVGAFAATFLLSFAQSSSKSPEKVS